MKVTKALIVLVMLISCISVNVLAEEMVSEEQIKQMRTEKRLVRVAGDPYPPWALGEAGTRPKGGIAVEIAEELFKRMNLETFVIIYPFKRGLQRIKDGDEDVILMVSKSKEREEYMLFTDSIRHVRFVFFHPIGMKNFNWSKWEDLRPYTIGMVTGYNYGKEWPEAIKKYNLKTEEVKTDVFNVEKLLLGRIDILLTDLEVMEEIIRRNPKYQGKIKHHEKPVFEGINNLGISKKSFLAPMLPRINRVLQGMKDDGTFERIFCSHDKYYRGSCE